jgi:hypothetical protein
VDQHQSQEDRLLDELTSGTPLADPAVVSVIRELVAEIGRLRSIGELADTGPTVEALTTLLLDQAAELQELRDRLQRVRALVELSAWAAGDHGEVDPSIRSSDIRHAIGGPIADRSHRSAT